MKRIALASLFLTCSQFYGINIKLLKGTHTIAFAYYSPVMGISFLEWGIAEQWYRLSPKYQAKEVQELVKKHPGNSDLQALAEKMGQNKNNATQDLIMLLYHVVRNSFTTTNAPDNPVKQLTPYHIGQILKLISKKMEQLDHYYDLGDQQADEKVKIERRFEELSQENIKISGNINRIKLSLQQEVDEAQKATLSAELNRYKLEIDRIKAEKVSLENLKKIVNIEDLEKYLWGKLYYELMNLLNSFNFMNEKREPLKWKRFVDALVGSLKESDEGVYPENTTQGLLLSYLLAKCDTKEDLQQYFRAFLDDQRFVLSSEEYTSQEIDQIIARRTDGDDFIQFADLVSAYTIKEKYDSSLPKIVNARETIYQGIMFTDCMDTTMRMLANIVTYQQGDGKVGVVPSGLTLNPAIEAFYADPLCQKSSEVGNGFVHQAWVNVIENVADCVYTKVAAGPDDVIDIEDIKNIKPNIAGFIPVAFEFTISDSGKILIDGIEYESHPLQVGRVAYQAAQKQVGDQIYLLISKFSNLVCFEMAPNYLNLVTGLNYIFDLRLYSRFSEIFEAEFISKKFEIICARFGWVVDIDFADLDTTKSLIIPIKSHNRKFFIRINYNGHGEVNSSEQQKRYVDITFTDIPAVPIGGAIVAIGFMYSIRFPFYIQSLNMKNKEGLIKYYVSHLNPSKQTGNKYLKSLIVDLALDSEFLYSKVDLFIKLLDHHYDQLLELGFDEEFIKNLLRIYKIEIPPFDILESPKILATLLKYKVASLEEIISFLDKNLYLIQQDIIEELFPFFEKGMSDVNETIRLDCIAFIIRLINKDLISKYDIDELLPLLEKGMSDENTMVRLRIIVSVINLVNKDLIDKDNIHQLLPLIKQAISDVGIKLVCIKLIILLVSKDLIDKDNVDQLLPLIKQSRSNSDETLRLKSIELVNLLVEKRLITEEDAQ